ncbi:unnamed protein product [Lota lota]
MAGARSGWPGTTGVLNTGMQVLDTRDRAVLSTSRAPGLLRLTCRRDVVWTDVELLRQLVPEASEEARTWKDLEATDWGAQTTRL